MRVVIAGHWSGTGVREAMSAGGALDAVRRGFESRRPTWDVDVIPFGPGRAVVETLALQEVPGYAPIVVGIEEESTRRAGKETLRAIDAGLTPLVEGGHMIDVDAGVGFLSEISGIRTVGFVESTTVAELREFLMSALMVARKVTAGTDLIALSSTQRPLLGLSSVMALDITGEPRTLQNRTLTDALGEAFAQLPPPRPELSVIAADPRARPTPPKAWHSMPGSGAAGGCAAMIAAMGGRIVPTGAFLSSAVDVPSRVARADLVLVAEPLLHSPQLAESVLPAVSQEAAKSALPVVALGQEATLSAYETAEWGIHGVVVTRGGKKNLYDAGARIAHTWAPSTG